MPIRHRSDFKQALSTLRQLKEEEEEEAQRNQRWTQSYSSSWWNWQESWWNSSCERKKKKELDKRPRPLAEINNGHKILLHGGIGKVHGGLLIPTEVTMEMYRVLIDQGNLISK